MTITRTCPICGEETSIEVTNTETLKQIARWERGEIYLQDIPLPASEREFIKTGYCMECQEILFAM